ncbi:hypothetical protein LWI29_009698 [Acer saccharum]|uniref:Uncharacterized protein n=1 Tax=Acer saccharum TaxID=4024 RepID=A0AA39VYI3_ACESA|nr:hypothetical protein LWI29_009698 [Acer saccharum]
MGLEDDDGQEYMKDQMGLEDDDQLEGPEDGDDVEYQENDDDDDDDDDENKFSSAQHPIPICSSQLCSSTTKSQSVNETPSGFSSSDLLFFNLIDLLQRDKVSQSQRNPLKRIIMKPEITEEKDDEEASWITSFQQDKGYRVWITSSQVWITSFQ